MLKGTSNIIGLKNESAKNAKVAYRVLQNLHFNHFFAFSEHQKRLKH